MVCDNKLSSKITKKYFIQINALFLALFHPEVLTLWTKVFGRISQKFILDIIVVICVSVSFSGHFSFPFLSYYIVYWYIILYIGKLYCILVSVRYIIRYIIYQTVWYIIYSFTLVGIKLFVVDTTILRPCEFFHGGAPKSFESATKWTFDVNIFLYKYRK